MSTVVAFPAVRSFSLASSVPDETSDDALLAAIAAGDERAFARLMARHADRAYAVARRMLRNASDAEDVVQEAFIRVHRSAASWQEGVARFSTWLHRVVVNLCIDHERRRRIRSWIPFLEDMDPPDDTADAERDLEGRNEIAWVRRELEGLPARQRAAILLSATGEHSNAEIAAILSTSEKAVEAMLVRARRTLRKKLAERDRETGR